MDKKISFKFMIPTFLVLFITVIVSVWLISSYVEKKLIDSVENTIKLKKEMIFGELELTNDLVMQQVKSGMQLLKSNTQKFGEPKHEDLTTVKGKTVRNISFGKTTTANSFEIVDEVKKIAGGTATIFSKYNGEYIRISTNVQKDDGSRAIGTILNPHGRAIKKIEKGEAYYGLVEILGKPYLTGYEPIFDNSNNIIGIWYTGYQLSSLNRLDKLISNTKILDNGFVALVNDNEKVVFNSAVTNKKKIINTIQSNNEENSNWFVDIENYSDWGYFIVSAYPSSDIESTVSRAKVNVVVIGLIVGAILLGIISFLVIKIILGPINKLNHAANLFTQGSFNVKIGVNGEDEFGNLAKSFNSMISNINSSRKELIAEKASVEKKIKEAVEESDKQKKYLSESINRILVKMEGFSQGDLTVKLDVNREDEIGKLFTGFNKAVQNISEMILNVSETVQTTANASAQISSSTEEMAAGAQEQSAQSKEVASAVEQMTKTIMDSASSASSASKASKDTSLQAREGVVKVEESKRGMDNIFNSAENTSKIIASLTGKTDQIGEIALVIDDIADQTNLLALNAAIEAARAGEQGRGFAVVADEVRKLAERTTKATKEIADTIRAIQNEARDADTAMQNAKGSVEKGIGLTQQVDDVLKNILASAGNVEQLINQVAVAGEEQSTAAEQISKSIEGINNVTQESTTGTQQIAKTAEDLNRLTENLQNLLHTFKTSLDNNHTYNNGVKSNRVLLTTK